MVILKIFKFISLKRRIQLFLLFTLMLINSFSEVLSITLLYPLLNLFSGSKELNFDDNLLFTFLNFNSESKNIIIVLFLLSFVFLSFTRLFYIYFRNLLSGLVGLDLNCMIYRNNLNKSYLEILNIDSSQFVSASSIHIEKTINAINNFLEFLCSILVTFTILSSLFLVDFKLTTFLLLALTFWYLITLILVKDKLLINSRIIAKKTKDQVQLIQETFSSFRTIVLHNTEKVFKSLFFKNEYLMRFKNAQNKFLIEAPRTTAETIGIILFVIYGAIFISDKIVPILGTFAFAAQRLLPAFQKVYATLTNIRSRNKDVEIVFKFLSVPSKSNYYKTNKTKYRSLKKIIFEDVSFKYSANSGYVIKNLNLEIKAGQKIAIIGSTGSGKSTFIDLLIGLIEPTEGSIYIDKNKLNSKDNNYFKSFWRSSISHVPQKLFLLNSSISKNISFTYFDEDIDYKKINSVVQTANLSNFVNNPKVGLDYLVGEYGNLLSGGQIQRIGIARALYKDFEILILDEATSALDETTRNKIQDNIRRKYSDKTIISISHESRSLDDFDKVLKFTANKIEVISN